ncbi:hypothetical protein M3661_00005, partial [Paenibacillus sp. MER 180]|uniref:hypothetical protein n=1 Tax=Paenibacillus sp. MER 180 TaxID=2939570 RepID=UPI00203ECCFF
FHGREFPLQASDGTGSFVALQVDGKCFGIFGCKIEHFSLAKNNRVALRILCKLKYPSLIEGCVSL